MWVWLTPPTLALVRKPASSSGRGSLEHVLTVEISKARNSLPWTFSIDCTSTYRVLCVYNIIQYCTLYIQCTCVIARSLLVYQLCIYVHVFVVNSMTIINLYVIQYTNVRTHLGYVCTHMHTYAYMYTCIHVHTCIHMYTHVHVHIHTCTCTYTSKCQK